MDGFFENRALSVALTAIIDLIRSYRLLAVMINDRPLVGIHTS